MPGALFMIHGLFSVAPAENHRGIMKAASRWPRLAANVTSDVYVADVTGRHVTRWLDRQPAGRIAPSEGGTRKRWTRQSLRNSRPTPSRDHAPHGQAGAGSVEDSGAASQNRAAASVPDWPPGAASGWRTGEHCSRTVHRVKAAAHAGQGYQAAVVVDLAPAAVSELPLRAAQDEAVLVKHEEMIARGGQGARTCRTPACYRPGCGIGRRRPDQDDAVPAERVEAARATCDGVARRRERDDVRAAADRVVAAFRLARPVPAPGFAYPSIFWPVLLNRPPGQALRARLAAAEECRSWRIADDSKQHRASDS